jgi:8-oxo-dGTP diphosphatase
MALKLPQEEFLKTFEKVPRVALNIIVEDNDGKFLLTKRSISPEKGLWHFPGSFLLKEEKIDECLKRITLSEFGYELKENPELMGVFEDLEKDPRGHVIDVMYKVKLNEQIPLSTTNETNEVRYFDKIPADIGFNHGETLSQLGYK